MMGSINLKRSVMALVAAAGAMLLAGCLVLPGKFAATLDLRKDGHFTYTYKGDIVILGLTRLAELAMAQKPKSEFSSSACYKKDGETKRDCTPTEVAEQKKDWITAQAAQAEKDEKKRKWLSGRSAG